MKILKSLLSWMSWILFGIISSYSISIAIVVAMAASLFSYSNLRKGFILEWTTLIFFITCFVFIVIFQNEFFAKYMDIFIGITLTSIASLSLLIKRPFTEQYAKLEVPKEYWKSFLFLRVNKIMTIVFSLLFLLKTLMSVYDFYYPEAFNFSLIFWPLLCLQCIFIQKFPNWYKKRHIRKSQISQREAKELLP